MQRWIFLALTLFTVSAQAINPISIGSRKQSDTPIRQATFQISLTKYVFTDANGGTFIAQPACSMTTTMGVYDARQTGSVNISSGDYYRMSCASTTGGASSDVLVGGVMALFTDNGSDRKAVSLGLWVDPDGPINDRLAADMSFSVDFGNQNVSTTLEPRVEGSCAPDRDGNMKCTTTMTEFYSADIRIVDTP